MNQESEGNANKADSKQHVRPCSVKVVRIAGPTDQSSRKTIAMSTRSKSSKSIENEKAIVPAKRTSRFKSTPAYSVEPNKESHSNQSKRRRLSDSSSTDGNASKKKKIEGDDMSHVVQLNCKLTNELLKLKNLVLEKTSSFIKLQKEYHHKTLECISLQSLLSEAKKKVETLSNAYDALKAERSCSDLIKFDYNDNDGLQMRTDAATHVDLIGIHIGGDSQNTTADDTGDLLTEAFDDVGEYNRQRKGDDVGNFTPENVKELGEDYEKDKADSIDDLVASNVNNGSENKQQEKYVEKSFTEGVEREGVNGQKPETGDTENLTSANEGFEEDKFIWTPLI